MFNQRKLWSVLLAFVMVLPASLLMSPGAPEGKMDAYEVRITHEGVLYARQFNQCSGSD